VAAISDVDVYDAPGGNGITIGILNFAGSLDQTDPVTASDCFDCTVRHGDPGVNATVRCTVQQLAPHTTTSIVVHGRGISAGPGQLVTLVNSDPGVGFDTKTQQLDVTIT